MATNEELRRVAEIDSRRVSTGLVCRIVRRGWLDPSYDDGLLDMLIRKGFLPDTSIGIPIDKGIDPSTGLTFVVPKHLLEFFDFELRNYSARTQSISDESLETKYSKEQAVDIRARREGAEFELLKNLQDHIILATVDTKERSAAELTGEKFDIFVHSREQGMPKAELFRRDNEGSFEASWNEQQKDRLNGR